MYYDLINTKIAKPSVAADANFRDREVKFRNQLKNKYVYRVRLKYICDLGKFHFPTKIDIKIRLTLETDMKRLFESDTNLNSGLRTGKSASSTDPTNYNIAVPDIPGAQIVLIKTLMIQYEQMTLNTNFRQYLETILYSAQTFQMCLQKTPYQRTYELHDLHKHLLYKQFLAWNTNGCSTIIRSHKS